ncbi:hypothetical protein LJC38_06685 [Parabacteroides sp. OttesenSCG-928-K15]|nr:hypothetical protein [Parabacteroides sp. OttesenSCG-928-K15]
MIVISPTELRANQKRYFDLAEKEQVFVKRGTQLIELVVKQKMITDLDLKHGISTEDVKSQVHEHIDKLFAE